MAGQIEVESEKLRTPEAHFLAALTRGPKAIRPHRELAYLYSIGSNVS